MPVTFAEDATDATGEEAKAADEARVTRDAPLARWASTPSFLTGSLSTPGCLLLKPQRLVAY